MPTALDLRGGGNTSPGSTPAIKRPTTYGSLTKEDVSGAGRVAIGISDPSKTLQQSVGNINAGFIGLGKGLVSIAENLPVIGAIAKPVIGVVGSIADNTIGRGVSLLEQVKVGDMNLAQAAVKGLEIAGTPLAVGVDALSWAGREVEKGVARARLINAQTGKNDIITAAFGNAPKEALGMIAKGATIEEAAEALANSNAGFSENGAANFIYSLILDPMNLALPGLGKAAAIGKQAAFLNRFGVAKLLEDSKAAAALGNTDAAQSLADSAAFLEKHQFVGKIYDQTIGRASGVAKKLAPTHVKEAALGWTRVHNVKVVDGLLDQLGKIAGKDIVDRGLKNYAATFSNAVKAGAVRARSMIVRSGAQDSADNILGDFIRKAKDGKEVVLATKAGDSTIGGLLKDIGYGDKVDGLYKKIDEAIKSGTREDEIRRMLLKERDEILELQSTAAIRRDQKVIRVTAKYNADNNVRIASEDAVRILNNDKLNRVPSAQNRAVGERELAEDLAAGFGIRAEDARAIAKSQFDQHAGDVRALTDVLSMARGAAFGQAMRETAGIRSLLNKVIKEGDEVLGKYRRVTIMSGRSLSETEAARINKQVQELRKTLKAAQEAGDDQLVASTKNELRTIADNLVQSYDEFSAQFGSETMTLHTYDSVLDYLKKAEKITVRDLTEKELVDISARAAGSQEFRQLNDLVGRLRGYGYRVGIAPEQGTVSKVTTLVTDHSGNEKIVKMTMPFADTLDDIAVNSKFTGELDVALDGAKLRPSSISRLWDSMTRPYGSEVVKANVMERFVSNLVSKTEAAAKRNIELGLGGPTKGVSVNEARQIMARLTTLAAQQETKIGALFMEWKQVNEIFQDVLGKKYGLIADAGSEPIKELVSAAAGDWSVAGLTSGLSGRVKALAPQITILTDRIYPEVRFGRLNPYFNLILERIETNIQLAVHNIRKEVADEMLGDIRGAVVRKAHLDPRNVVREITDGTINGVRAKATRNTVQAVNTADSFRTRVANATRGFFSRDNWRIDTVRDAKKTARDIMTDKLAAREFADILEQVAPGKLNELAVHYGLKNSDEVIESLLVEYMLQADPVRFAEVIAQNSKAARRLSVEALTSGGMPLAKAEDIVGATVAAYEIAVARASRVADKAQYFASQRTWLERSLNHPFLGVYPYSYMVQKAVPSLLRVMFLTPGPKGIIMPGFGYNNYEKVVEWMENRSNTDEDVISQLVQNDALLYVFSTILPTTPEASGFSTPTWLRRSIVQPGLRGTPLTPGELAPALTEAGATLIRGTALGQARTTIEGAQAFTDIAGKGVEQAAENVQDLLSSTLRNP